MITRKFLVYPDNFSCREIEGYKEVPNCVIIGRWHCSPDCYLIETVLTGDWNFFGTIMVQAEVAGVIMPALVIAHFDHERGIIISALRTANAKINMELDHSRRFNQTMTRAFTPVGRHLNILPPDGVFELHPIPGSGSGEFEPETPCQN